MRPLSLRTLIPRSVNPNKLSGLPKLRPNSVLSACTNPSLPSSLQRLLITEPHGEISRETVFEFCNDREDVAKITGERETSPANGQEANLSTQFN